MVFLKTSVISISSFISGSRRRSLENKIFNTATFSLTVLSLIISIVTLLLADKPLIFTPLLIAPLVYTGFFYASRFRGHFRLSATVFLVFSVLFFDYLWFAGIGLHPSVSLLFPLLLVLALTILPVRNHLLFIGIMLVNLFLMVVAANNIPGLIYKGGGMEADDLVMYHLFLALFMLILSFLLSYFKHHYERERERSDQKNRQLNNNYQAIENRNQHLETLARMVSHNLRSPIAGMKMLFELYERMETPEQKEEIVENLREGASTLFDMVEDLARVMLDYKELNRETESIKLKEVAAKVRGQLSGMIQSEEAEVNYDFSDYPEVNYLPVYLESIFLNLVSNAIKYRSPDRPPIVDVRSYLQEGKVMLSFCDNGLGIDLSQHREQLFKMYKTFHRQAGSDSKGIGLFMTKNQVEMMGGKLSVSSEPGKGSCFYVELYRL